MRWLCWGRYVTLVYNSWLACLKNSRCQWHWLVMRIAAKCSTSLWNISRHVRRHSHFTTCQWCRHKKEVRKTQRCRRATHKKSCKSATTPEGDCTPPWDGSFLTFIELIGFAAKYRNLSALERLKLGSFFLKETKVKPYLLQKFVAYFAAHSWVKRDDYMMNDTTSHSTSQFLSLYLFLWECECINHLGLVVDCLGNSIFQTVIWLVLCHT